MEFLYAVQLFLMVLVALNIVILLALFVPKALAGIRYWRPLEAQCNACLMPCSRCVCPEEDEPHPDNCSFCGS